MAISRKSPAKKRRKKDLTAPDVVAGRGAETLPPILPSRGHPLRHEALAFLGLGEDATDEEVALVYAKLMRMSSDPVPLYFDAHGEPISPEQWEPDPRLDEYWERFIRPRQPLIWERLCVDSVDPATLERLRQWQNDPLYGTVPYEAVYPGGDPEDEIRETGRFTIVRRENEWKGIALENWASVQALGPEEFDRLSRAVAIWESRRDLDDDALGRLADAFRWKPHRLAQQVLRRQMAETGLSFQTLKRQALVTGIVLALDKDKQPQRLRFGRSEWVVDERERRTEIIPRQDLGPVDYVYWLRKEAINQAEEILLSDAADQHRRGVSKRTERGHQVTLLARMYQRRRPAVSLSPQEQRLLALYAERYAPQREAALRLGTTPSTIKTTWARIRRTFACPDARGIRPLRGYDASGDCVLPPLSPCSRT